MMDLQCGKIFFFTSLILGINLLPVYLFRRKASETLFVGAAIICFFAISWRFISKGMVMYHDAGQHEYIMLIFKQWLDKGISIGWNPYMNAGEPLCLFSNIFLWAPWVFFCRVNGFVGLDSDTLFNLYWVFQFVSFCAGGFLLFSLLYDDFRAAFFSFIALMFSGMFIMNLGAQAGMNTLYYYPYLLFCIILFFKKKNVYGAALAIIFLGAAMNHYLPHYIFLCTGIIVLFILVLHADNLRIVLLELKKRYKVILFAIVIALFAASPALLTCVEMRSCISPMRRGVHGMGVKIDDTGRQSQVNAPLYGYRVLLDRMLRHRENIHHAFYFGMIPLLLVPVALLAWRNRYMWVFLCGAIVTMFMGTGFDFWGYRFLMKYFPGFNMVRHTFELAQAVCFLMIVLAGYGLKEILKKDRSPGAALVSAVLVFSAFAVMLIVSPRPNVVLFGSLGTGVLVLISARRLIPHAGLRDIGMKLCYTLVMFFLFADLTLFYIRHYDANIVNYRMTFSENRHSFQLANIVYPLERAFYSAMPYPIPMDISSLILKKASLTHPEDNFVFLRTKRLDDMLKLFVPGRDYEKALGVDGPLVYFTDKAEIRPASVTKKQFIEEVYNGTSGNNRSVFFAEGDIDFAAPEGGGNTGKWSVEFAEERSDPNVLEMDVNAPADGFLVRLENYHSGWKAFIDGRPARIYRANYAFGAVRVPQGAHRIVFRFSSIYPALMYIHILCVFLAWCAFNIWVWGTGKE